MRGAVHVEDGGAYWSQALLRTQEVPSTSKLTTSDPTRTGDMGHVKHVSLVRRKSWEAVRGAVQVQDGESYWSHSHLRTKWAPSMPKLATSDPPEDRRLQSRDTCGSGAEEEMASSGRRSAGTGRQIIAVARCFEDTRRPLDVEVGDKRPHKDRRLRPCDSYVSGAMGERVRRARRSVGP